MGMGGNETVASNSCTSLVCKELNFTSCHGLGDAGGRWLWVEPPPLASRNTHGICTKPMTHCWLLNLLNRLKSARTKFCFSNFPGGSLYTHILERLWCPSPNLTLTIKPLVLSLHLVFILHEMFLYSYTQDTDHSISHYQLTPIYKITRDLALASMARDDPPASSTASSTAAVLLAARRPQCAVKWDRNLKAKLAIMRQCSSVTDRRTDRRTLTEIFGIRKLVPGLSCGVV